MSEQIKKTVFLNQENVDRAVRFFNVKTEKEAINRALELAVAEGEIIETHKKMGGSVEIEDVFG